MRAVLQRVSSARVEVDTEIVGEIGRGLLVLVGVAGGDDASTAERLADAIVGLRIFPDDAGKMNRSVADVGGGVLVVSEPPDVDPAERWPAAGLASVGLARDPDEIDGVVRLRQVASCPDRFPRRVGVPAKRPLF